VADLQERDRRDATRETSPLKAADDAVHIDSTGLNIDEVTAAVERVVEDRLKNL
jgi:CMP/dCMP kinase